MSPRIRRYFRGRGLTPLIAVTVAALVCTALLVLVRLRWRPLERADHGAASDINSLMAGQHTLVTIVKDVTLLGSTIAVLAVVAAGAILLLIRRQWRLATYLVVTGAGALVLDPVLKSLVGRLRPVLAHPVAHAPGNSFPSGHALGSLVCYGAIFVVFIPAARGRWRTVFTVVIAVLVALIGISRILLGVHYLSDVLGGWAIGVAWLGRAAGLAVPGRRPATRRVGTVPRPDRRARRAGRQGGQRQRPRRPDHPALVRGTPHADTEPLEPDPQHARHHGGHHRRGGVRLPRIRRRHPTPAAGRVHRDPPGRRGRDVPHGGGHRQTAQAGRAAPRPRLAHLGLPLRARGSGLLPLHRAGSPGHRVRPRLVAVAVPDPGDRLSRPGRDLPLVPRRASSDRHRGQPRLRRALRGGGRPGGRVRVDRVRDHVPHAGRQARRDLRSARQHPAHGQHGVVGGQLTVQADPGQRAVQGGTEREDVGRAARHLAPDHGRVEVLDRAGRADTGDG